MNVRIGIGWRPELAPSILAHLDEIDVVEVLAEERASRRQLRALRFVATQVPVCVHATQLGLAGVEPVAEERLERVARVVDAVEPEFWSEHLAFVRAGGFEIGHLAAPPRNEETLAGLVRNVERARRVIGTRPLLENVASLIDPPLSTFGEGEWMRAAAAATGCDLLLDLHNLHANAHNFGFDAMEVVRDLPPGRVGAIHVAGGRRIENDRILDDHRHDVPEAVFDLLVEASARGACRDVILERDGNYPPFDVLLGELRRIRSAVIGDLHDRAAVSGSAVR